MSRQMIADPYWANKALARQPQEIRKCISCLVGCWQESLMVKRHMRCTINPAVGDERFIELEPARTALRVAVVGGGPGGMEAARIATLRGHQVTIFEKTGELGGAILSCCTVPGKHKMRWYADWLRYQIQKLNVAVQLRATVGSSSCAVRRRDPGHRVRFLRPDVPGIGLPLVTRSKTCCGAAPSGANSTMHGQACADRLRPDGPGLGRSFRSADAAEKLAFDGKKVYVVTEAAEFAAWMEPCHRDVMFKRFAGGNGEGLKGNPFAHAVTVIPRTTVTGIAAGGRRSRCWTRRSASPRCRWTTSCWQNWNRTTGCTFRCWKPASAPSASATAGRCAICVRPSPKAPMPL
jgi:hypothetical protein